MPVTWAALEGDSRYGENSLQRRVDAVKSRLFGAVVPAEEEADTYPSLVVEYAGKLVALAVIPAGEDYWAAQTIMDNSGEKFSGTWIDRAESLRRLRRELIAETRAIAPEVAAILGTTIRVTKVRPRVGVRTPRAGHVTATPEDFPKDFALPEEATGPVAPGGPLSVPA